MKVVILGSGNVASYCCSRMAGQEKVRLVQLYARNVAEGDLIAAQFRVPVVNDLEAIARDADVYIFAVADGAIVPLADRFFKTNALLVHCAGSQPAGILASASELNGVIWPVYSLKKHQKSYPDDIPLVVDASNDVAKLRTERLARAISKNVSYLDHAQRKFMHLNAVLVNNFTNHLMAIAERICEQQQVDFNILLPMIRQTATGVGTEPPFARQTGPAKRGDVLTMQQHLELLAQHPDWQKVYESLSASIAGMYR